MRIYYTKVSIDTLVLIAVGYRYQGTMDKLAIISASSVTTLMNHKNSCEAC